MTNDKIDNMSQSLHRYIKSRDENKEALAELRRIAVEELGFDQGMVAKAAVQDLVYGYLKGFRAGQKGGAE